MELNQEYSLLDASGNDGDRGALIVTFAEALVLDGNPQEYITLLDRLVDDYDNLFDGKESDWYHIKLLLTSVRCYQQFY